MKIDLEQIKTILKNPDKNKCYYVNTKNGKIFSLDQLRPSPEEQAFWKELEENPESYLGIPIEYDLIEYEVMEDFVKTLKQGHSKKSLNTIIQRIGAFTRFSQLVKEYELEEAWLTFQDQEYDKLIKTWCNISGVSIAGVPRD